MYVLYITSSYIPITNVQSCNIEHAHLNAPSFSGRRWYQWLGNQVEPCMTMRLIPDSVLLRTKSPLALGIHQHTRRFHGSRQVYTVLTCNLRVSFMQTLYKCFPLNDTQGAHTQVFNYFYLHLIPFTLKLLKVIRNIYRLVQGAFIFIYKNVQYLTLHDTVLWDNFFAFKEKSLR